MEFAQQQPSTNLISLFGVVIPGRPLLTCFQLISETKAITVIEAPLSVYEITFFLLPTTPIPAGFGAVLYYSTNNSDWEILGCVTPSKPSGIFRTGWATNEAVVRNSSVANSSGGGGAVYLGVTLEPLGVIENLSLNASGVEDRFLFASNIAKDLYAYMTSCCIQHHGNAMLVPVNIFDSWIERFNRKYKQDPNFMMKEKF
jgi:hypothetical protein